jgi:hypothetical protein
METKNDNQPQAQNQELMALKAKQDAEFALSPVGQQLKQFEIQQRIAQMYSTSTIVPDTYRGNLGNCVIALDMAQRMGANPLMVMQNLVIVHGTPSFSAKFLVASINASGRYTSLQYEWQGEQGKPEWGCRCVAYEKSDTKREHPLQGTLVTMQMADAEGWSKKNGSKWLTMPQQMLMYRAAAFWQRAYCPEITMGFISTEEAYDIEDAEYETIESHANRVEQEIKDNANKGPIGFQAAAQEEKKEAKKDPKKDPEPEAQPAQNQDGQPQGQARQRPLWAGEE